MYLIIFAVVVLSLGWLYSFLTPYGQGIGKNSEPFSDITFLNGVYFSVVTVTSLGYGDMSPIGFSKFFACVEVLFGLAWMGVMVAKITSRRLSYHIKRLFSTDAQKRLEYFVVQFERSNEGLSKAMKALGRAYQKTPGENGQHQEEKAQALDGFNSSLTVLHAKSTGLADYLSYEIEQADYFAIVPTDIVRRLGNIIDRGMFVLGQIIISLTPEVRNEILNSQNRQRISETLGSQRTIGNVLKQNSKDQEVKECADRILETCKGLPESYFTMPIIVAEAEQPDQVPVDSVDPQESNHPNP